MLSAFPGQARNCTRNSQRRRQEAGLILCACCRNTDPSSSPCSNVTTRPVSRFCGTARAVVAHGFSCAEDQAAAGWHSVTTSASPLQAPHDALEDLSATRGPLPCA